jgi:hypothetical protein
LAIAINDRILVLDSDWRLMRVLSHRWMGGAHELAADDEGLWIACTDNDLLFGLDWEGRLRGSWHWRSDRRLRRALGLRWLPPFDRWADHRDPFGGGLRVNVGHVNAVTLDGAGMLVGLGLLRRPPALFRSAMLVRGNRLADRAGLAGFAANLGQRWRRDGAVGSANPEGLALMVTPGKLGTAKLLPAAREWTWAIVELDAAPGGRTPSARLVCRHPAKGAPAHNAVIHGDRIVVNDSPRGVVLALSRSSGEIERSVSLGGEKPFPRGLVHLGNGRFLVGTQRPAALNVVDLESEEMVERIRLPDDHGETIFGLAPVPDTFMSPEARLPDSRAGWPIPGADARDGSSDRKGDSPRDDGVCAVGT